MSRQIKFRAWDGSRMVTEPGYIQVHTDKDFHVFIDESGQWENDDIHLMQFTGLQDKAGRDIYEGDVVRFVGGTCDYLQCGIYADQRIEQGEMLLVKSLPSGFTLSRLHLAKETIPNLVGHVDNYMFWNHQRSLELVGNVYENHELLTNLPTQSNG